MAKRRYYSFEKRQKELKREKKNEAKLERRRLKKGAAGGEQPEDEGEVAEGERVGEADLDNAPAPESGQGSKCLGTCFFSQTFSAPILLAVAPDDQSIPFSVILTQRFSGVLKGLGPSYCAPRQGQIVGGAA